MVLVLAFELGRVVAGMASPKSTYTGIGLSYVCGTNAQPVRIVNKLGINKSLNFIFSHILTDGL